PDLSLIPMMIQRVPEQTMYVDYILIHARFSLSLCLRHLYSLIAIDDHHPINHNCHKQAKKKCYFKHINLNYLLPVVVTAFRWSECGLAVGWQCGHGCGQPVVGVSVHGCPSVCPYVRRPSTPNPYASTSRPPLLVKMTNGNCLQNSATVEHRLTFINTRRKLQIADNECHADTGKRIFELLH